jgi:hypothetical protein
VLRNLGAEGKHSDPAGVQIIYFRRMNSRLLFSALCACFLSLNSFSQDPANKEADIRKLKAYVTYLADDKLEGRETGTKGEKMAAKYIRKKFAKMGIGPLDKYAQVYTRKLRPADLDPHKDVDLDTVDAKTIKGANITGQIDNGAKQAVVIGAHYDHLGWGGPGSLAAGQRAIHNGADDNASGVAVMMLLAEWLQTDLKNNNYIFIAFSGEEKGLWGSNFFVKNTPYPIEQMNYMINMDMVGRLKDDRSLAINGSGTSPVWNDVTDKMNAQNFKLVKKESGIGPSDHTSFYLADVPVLHFFTGQHEDYHKPSDDVEKVNFEGMYDIARYIYSIIAELDDDGKLKFTKTKDESAETPRFKVTLGVVPDYLYDGEGMRIDGVRADRPAQKAGMQKGDIVIKMGDIEVKDMMSYMKGLSKFEKGQKTIVRYKRGEVEEEVEVTF